MIEERKYLVNGIDIHIVPQKHLHTFCIGIYLPAGILYEDEKSCGISHLYEHMVFRNLKARYEGDFYELMSSKGVFIDGCTYKEFMYFSIYGVTDGYDLALDILSKMFMDLDISKEEYQAEKGRIKAEIRENDDKKTTDFFHGFYAWKGTGLSRMITGSASSVEGVSLKKLESFRKELFSEGNVILYATGCVEDEEALLDTVRKLPVSKERKKKNNIAPVPEGFRERNGDIHIKKGDCTCIGISFDIDNTAVSAAEADLIYSILFTNEDAAVFKALSEDAGVIYSYDSSLEQYRNISMLKLVFEVDEGDIYSALETLLRELDGVKKGKFNFDINLRKQLTNWTMMLDSPGELNWALAYENDILGLTECRLERPAAGKYDKVSYEDCVRAAEDIFRRENMVLVFKGNRKKIDLERVRKIVEVNI